MNVIYYELCGCKEGEINSMSNDLFCKLRGNFCMYIKKCPVGYVKEVRG